MSEAAAPAAPVALVTGASAGTGSEIARALAAAGYAVALLGRRADALAALARELAGAPGGDALALVADVRDAAALDAALDRFLAWSGGRVDAVVNAAGITGPLSPPLGDYGVEAFDAVMATNVRAPFLILSRLLPVMRAARAGRIVNIGGNHGMRGRAGRSSYSTSKWALRGLTRSAALEAGPDGVTVNYVAPGPVAVPRMRAAWRERAAREGVDEATATARYVAEMGIPLGRPSEPADIVATVMFLLGPGGRNVTGQELVVDGGATL